MNKIRVVVIDCDGVMFDTTASNTAYYNQILNYCGNPSLTSRQFEYAHMHTADAALAYLFSDEKKLNKAQDYRKTMSYLPFIKGMKEEPHLKPLLNKIRPHYKTAVATNRSDTMDDVLKQHGLDIYFDLVVTSLDVEHPKPHPELLIKILTYFNVKPDEAIYVGDSKLDEMAAKAAQIPLVSYNNSTLAADFHINSLKEIEGLLNL